MTIDFLKRLLAFVSIVLAQALILSSIQLFHCATPLLLVYFVIAIPRGYPRWATLLWGFSLGLCVDMFINTPGMSAASLTLIALLQPYMIELFLPREADEKIKSSVSALGFWRFLGLAALLTSVFCLVFFAIEQFSFFNVSYWLQCAGASALLTLLLILAIETLRR